jgi:maleylacetate reductase
MIAGMHQSSLMERVLYGCTIGTELPQELARLGRQRVFIVSNRSLSHTLQLKSVVAALGKRYVGAMSGISAHAPREDILLAAEQARQCDADLLLAVGGGSVIDAAKVMLLCLRHGYTDPAQLDADAGQLRRDLPFLPADASQWIRLVAVPTTFSAAELTAQGGATEIKTKAKQAFGHPLMMPQVVLYDPALTLTAPMPLLLATGMKAVDHAVERLANPRANGYSDAVSALALNTLVRGLNDIRASPQELEPRARVQYGMFLSMQGLTAGVRGGLSHAIAHALGSYCDVSHGHTSCVLLPSSMQWALQAAPEANKKILTAMGLNSGDAATALRALIEGLGLPSRLSDVGVKRADLQTIAERSLHDPLIVNSPRKVCSAEDVLSILDAAW